MTKKLLKLDALAWIKGENMRKILIVLLLLNYMNITTNATQEKSHLGTLTEVIRQTSDSGYTIDNTAKSKLFDRRIEKGLNYLHENQLPTGEFPIYLSLSPDMSHTSNVTTYFGSADIIFDTGLILHTLNIADNKNTKKIVYEMKNKAIVLLLNNMERHNVWKFFGKNHYIPPDIDDTSVLFAGLVESGVNISNESLDYMLNYRTNDDVFYVWMNSEEWLNSSNPLYNVSKFRLNEIDPNVNVNALYAYSLRKRTQNGVIKYLKDIIENGTFKNGSTYYPSPYVFTYLVTKAYSDGKVKKLKPNLGKIKEYLLKTQNPDGGWGNDLYTALATNALINMDYKGHRLEKAIEHILNTQENNGSWDIYSIYILPERPIYFGSQELTTSFNLEALIKYKKHLNILDDDNSYFIRKNNNVEN